MRISTNQIFTGGIDAIQRGQFDLNRTALQLGTGRRILTPSDDPANAATGASLESLRTRIDQYQRNIGLARAPLAATESAVTQSVDLVQRARELAIQANNAPQTSETRSYIAGEIRQIRDAVFEVANTRNGNGEFLFAGTRSLETPFRLDGSGAVVYSGASEPDGVRRVAISATRELRLGETGERVFMTIPENAGRPVAEYGGSPQGAFVVASADVVDPALLDDDTYTIEFLVGPTGSQFRVLDGTSTEVVPPTDYRDGTTIEFAGRGVTIQGQPAAGDTVESRPAEEVSVFDVLDRYIAALEGQAPAGPAGIVTETNRLLADIDAVIERFSDVRSSVGTRLQALDSQEDFNEQRLLDLESTLSEIRDLDYAEAISRFNRQQVALQAAQQTYSQTARLSLFNFL
ncbi:MAG: flagellar hook-associated protein FlgL [Thioalkalivibrionaceae bacterium]